MSADMKWADLAVAAFAVIGLAASLVTHEWSTAAWAGCAFLGYLRLALTA